jgi:hypothetical protein
MLSGHRSAWRRRGRSSRAARIAVPLAIPMALGLTLGIILAVSGGPVTTINQSATGACASPSASAANAASAASPAVSGSPAAAASASAAPCPTASASASTGASTGATAAVPAAPTFATGRTAFFQLGDVATNPVDGTGAAINLNQTAAQAAASLNCTLTVPNNPLSARGLATPWQLGDGCSEATSTEQAFVEATILSPNGQLQVYNPLVIDAGATPAAAPVVPKIPRGSQVIIDVGFNGTNLLLKGRGARQGNCVDALGQSVIGQVSACNAVNFYRLANFEIGTGRLQIPARGNANDGQACMTVRDFAMVDQDQSDNVVTSYLMNANGQIAQNTAANAAAMNGATTLVNGSDDKLLAAFLDPATGCTPFTAPDITDPAGSSASQALNELSALVNQKGVIAVVPTNDEMTLVGGSYSIAKTNVYRSLVDQPLLPANTDPAAVAMAYCQNMSNIAPARSQLDMTREAGVGSPVPAVGNTLATFIGNRLAMSFANLGCNNFGLTNPVAVTVDGNQVATTVAYNLAQQKAVAPAAAGASASASAGGGGTGGNGGTGTTAGGGNGGVTGPPSKHHRRGHHYQDPSGM